VLSSVQTHPFVKEACVKQGMSPMIMCYNEQQIADLKRFCTSKTPSFLRTVLGVTVLIAASTCVPSWNIWHAESRSLV